jgi:hypothetical protein
MADPACRSTGYAAVAPPRLIWRPRTARGVHRHDLGVESLAIVGIEPAFASMR